MKIPIETILEDGVTAPSGENCQPWRFMFGGSKLSVFNIPEADFSLYNNKQRGSYIAHGALLENIALSAKKHGYTTTVSLFPEKNNDVHVADVFFEGGDASESLLYSQIQKRCTNRKDYKEEKLLEREKKELVHSVDGLGYNTYKIVDDTRGMKRLGEALAFHEKVLFENKKMHDFFYSHILWDKKDEEKAGGFFIDTLEFLPHQRKAVKLFKSWPILSCLNRILKVSTMISKENGEKYAKGGAFGAIMMSGTTNEDFVRLGMSMQRLWLTATGLDIAMHPCNGTLYLMNHLEDSGAGDFSEKHNRGIRGAYQEIVEQFSFGDKKIGFIFRMGKADPPTATAKRKVPVVRTLGLKENT